MLEVMGSEFIKLARAKGLREGVVIWKHGLKNAAIPIVTYFSLVLSGILVGSIAIETVFAWPGMGLLVIDAIRWNDYPVVQGVALVYSTFFVFMNLLVDILYVYLNPKIRYSR